MTEDFLIKEKEFHQLNRELEKKANDLMDKINCVINSCSNECNVLNLNKSQGNIIKEETDRARNIKKINSDNAQLPIKRNSSLPHISDPFSISQFGKVELPKDDQTEGPKRKSLANETIINLFKAKIDVLLNELQTIRVEYKKKCDVCKNLEAENKKYEMKLQTETESLKDTIGKLENTIKEFQSQSQTLSSENLLLKKELDKLEKQIKIINQESHSNSARLNRSLENNDKLKGMLKNFEVEEKELKAQIRKLQEDRRFSIQNMGKQLSEVVQVLKKQMIIVDNLKRQNACLAAVGQIKCMKEDFSRLLEEKPESLK